MNNTEVTLVVPGTTRIAEAPVPVPKADEVLIRVEYVGICGSDVHSFESGPFIPPSDPSQKIGLGHECAGTVVEVGEKVTKSRPGDRVCIEPGVPCGTCRQVMMEFAPELTVICLNKNGESKKFALKELLPYGFDQSWL